MTLEHVRLTTMPSPAARRGRSVLGAAVTALLLLATSTANAQDPTAPPAAPKRAPRAAAKARHAAPTPPTEAEAEADAAAEEAPAEQAAEVDETQPSEEDWAEAEDAGEVAAEQAEPEAEPAPPPRARRQRRRRDDGAEHQPHRHHHRQPAPARRPASRAPAAPPPAYAVPGYGVAPSGYWSQPYELEYVEGAAVPEGYRKDTRIRKGLVIGGAVTFGTTWLLSSLAATVMIRSRNDSNDYTYSSTYRRSDNKGMPGAAVLYIPIAGPFVAIHTLDSDGGGAALLFVDGMAQAAGFSMFVAGLAAKRTVLVKTPETSVALAPAAPGTASGASLVGTF